MMEYPRLEPQPPTVTVDEATKALLNQSQVSAQRGETVMLEQSIVNMRRRLKGWRKAKFA